MSGPGRSSRFGRFGRSGRLGVAMAGAAAWLAVCLPGCGTTGPDAPLPPLPRAAQVDLARYMGDWYVIASIPSFIERDAYDAVESYALRPDGRIQTTFRYRKGAHDAELNTMRPIGSVVPGTGNAVWGMQFIWPIQAEYVIAYLSDDSSQTIVARSDRDYVWIMARTPRLPDKDYQALLARVQAMGYDLAKIRKVPHAAGGQ